MRDEISAVIPTRNRPDLVYRAVRSALSQTYPAAEIIVVVDGPDEATARALAELDGARVKVVALPENVGPSGARNAGVREAKGTWIAFLDDDDEWLPSKLERQIEAARRSRFPFPVIATSFVARTGTRDTVLPKKALLPGEPIGDYLFYRASVLEKEGIVLTSTMMARKELLMKVPFPGDLRRYEDWDVVLRAARMDGVGFHVMQEALAIRHMEERGGNLSALCDWESSLDWIRQRRDLVTPRAYGGYLSTVVADQASRQREWRTFAPLLREMRRASGPGLSAYLLYLAMWLVPKRMR